MNMPTLSRRELIGITSAVVCSQGSAWTATGNSNMMVDYLLRQLLAADEQRRKKLAAIQSREQVLELQQRVRRMMHGAFGPFPDRTPLHPQQTGELQRSGYVIEKIIFESRPGYYVTANLYRPNSGSERRAAVVQSCGHYDEGKAKDDYQRACIGLVKRGFVVLIFDPVGQGERFMYREPGVKKMPGGEHPIAGTPMLLLGRTLANYRMWDIMRAFDYLETRPDVDKTRMGLLGHSGGGMMTLLTSPLEPRIQAAMSCCAVTTFYDKTRLLKTADPEQKLPGVLSQSVDHPEMIAGVAPRAFLIGAVLRETNLPLEGTRRTYEEARRLYEIMGVPDKVGKVESDNVHMLDKNLREGCYGWMLKHLANETHADTREAEMTIETPETLRCTKTGSVMPLEKARSVFDLNRSCSQQLAKARPARISAKELRSLLPSIEVEPGIEIPTTLAPGGTYKDVLVVVISEKGRKSAYAQEVSSLISTAGYTVLSADLRGWGDTNPEMKRSARDPWEEYFAWTALELGRPLLAMRVADLLGTVRPRMREYKKVYLAGLEGGGLVALHAAFLEPAIAGVATNRSLVSYQDVLDRRISAEPSAGFVWGALARYDLPDLARGLSPRAYIAVDPFAATRRPVSGSDPVAASAAVPRMLAGLMAS